MACQGYGAVFLYTLIKKQWEPNPTSSIVTPNLKHKAMIATMYSGGLRVSEVTHLHYPIFKLKLTDSLNDCFSILCRQFLFYRLGNEFVTDFAYLTKSSDYWEFVLVELEDAKKKIFTNDKENIYFHSEFNHAYDQITSWKAYVNKNREAILHQIDKLRVPLNENSVRFKYVLVIGRNAEKDNSEKRRAMFAEKSDNDIRVMTYDSLVSQCKSVPYNGEKIILSTWKEQGFKIKKLPKQEISTSLFAYLKPEYLQISERDIEILKEQDYQIDIWLSGRALSYNDKYDAASLAERTTNPLKKAVLLAEAKNNK